MYSYIIFIIRIIKLFLTEFRGKRQQKFMLKRLKMKKGQKKQRNHNIGNVSKPVYQLYTSAYIEH